jgi:hypothetical protein
VSPESITPGANDIDGIATPRDCGVWIPGLRASRLGRLTCIPE